MVNIYCDEAGFTGDNLLDDQNVYFVYSSIAIDAEQAKELVANILKDCRIQGELKGTKLLKTSCGRDIILRLISENTDRIKLTFFDKKYTLACKFYEFIFGELLSNDVLFYQLGFNKFVSNALYLSFITKEINLETIFSEFQRLMRAQDINGIKYLFAGSPDAVVANPILNDILNFCLFQRDAIIKELDFMLNRTDGGKWNLDITATALSSLLAHWGETFSSLSVYCDTSKPLADHAWYFDMMINRERAAYLTSGKESAKITYNLAGPIQLVKSKDHFGIQIADIIASACCYCLNNPKESYSNSFINTIMPSFHLCVIPESEYADLTLREPFVNSLVLAELTERSRAGKDLLTDMLEFVLRAFDSYAAKISGSK